MKTEAQIIEALRLCEVGLLEMKERQPALSNRIAQDVLNWVLGRPSILEVILDGSREIISKRN